MGWKETMQEMNEVHSVCWMCKKELREYEVCTVTDGGTLDIDLCFECYGKHGGEVGLSEKDTFQMF